MGLLPLVGLLAENHRQCNNLNLNLDHHQPTVNRTCGLSSLSTPSATTDRSSRAPRRRRAW